MKKTKPADSPGFPTTEQKILAAARAEFSEKGLDGARMHAIALRAGVNKALLHYYFRSKDKLFEITLKSIVSDLWTDIHKRLHAYAGETDLRALIHAIVTAYITTFAANPEMPRVIIGEAMRTSPVLLETISTIFSSMSAVPETIFTIYSKELKRVKIKRIPLIHFMMNLMGMCAVTFIIQPLAESIGKDRGVSIHYNQTFYSERIKAITDMACDGIFIERFAKAS